DAPPRTIWTRVRVFIPWLIAFGVLLWLFRIVPAAKLAQAMQRVAIAPFIVLTLVIFGGTLLTDTFATWVTFRTALPGEKITYREVLDLRGASYLLAIINYGAGQGGLGYFLNQKHKVDGARATGIIL